MFFLCLVLSPAGMQGSCVAARFAAFCPKKSVVIDKSASAQAKDMTRCQDCHLLHDLDARTSSITLGDPMDQGRCVCHHRATSHLFRHRTTDESVWDVLHART